MLRVKLFWGSSPVDVGDDIEYWLNTTSVEMVNASSAICYNGTDDCCKMLTTVTYRKTTREDIPAPIT
jgi:hypothetical protein